jgi:riboflavin kinase/FMN adenylyltransferase
MQVFRDLESAVKSLDRPVLTVGNFDGVHRGHQAIVEETVRVARKMNRPPVVLTFEPHPQRVFKAHEPRPLLTTLPQKLRLLDDLTVEATIICPFDDQIYHYEAHEFFTEILVSRIGAVHLVEGMSFTFGRGRTGSPELLRKLGGQHHVGVTIVPSILLSGKPISSSRIRSSIQHGDVAEARSLLGRPYAVEGEKVSGKGRGRTLGYPTVNILSENELLPATGIYAVQSECGGRVFPGAASLGFNPTFEGDHFSFEVHLLDFQGIGTDDRLRVLFYERLRDEIAFDRPEDLITQIEADVMKVRGLFQNEV